MGLKRLAFLVLFTGCGSVLATAAAAQRLPGPASSPPANYGGREYVDARGCAFVRAEVDGRTQWVHRVTRARAPVCGLPPTFAPQPREAVALAPVIVPEGSSDADAQALQRAAAVTELTRAKARPAASRAAPARRTTSRRAPVTRPAASHAAAPAIVLDGSDAGPGQRAAIRVVQPSASVRPGGFRPPGLLQIIPDHVWAAGGPIVIARPQGYEEVWQDGRLNPFRAWQTVRGYYDTQRLWTNEVPRRLIWRRGEDSAKNPVLIGYVDPAARPYRSRQHATGPARLHGHDGRGRVVSTRTEPQRDPGSRAPASEASRYVEIGIFTSEDKARAAAERLAGQGLRARIGTLRRDGQVLRRVQAGPFSGGAALDAAMARVREAGYPHAYLR